MVEVLQLRCHVDGKIGRTEEFGSAHREQEPPRRRVVEDELRGRVRGCDHGVSGRLRGVAAGEGGLHHVPLQVEESTGGAEPGPPDQPRAGAERVVDRAIGDAGQVRQSAHRDRGGAGLRRQALGCIEQLVEAVDPRARHAPTVTERPLLYPGWWPNWWPWTVAGSVAGSRPPAHRGATVTGHLGTGRAADHSPGRVTFPEVNAVCGTGSPVAAGKSDS